MKTFLIKFLLFLVFGLLVGELIVRKWYLTSEIPQRYLNERGIQKYLPGQQGHWKGGGHTWQTNQLGWTGTLPKKYDNLVTLIGDSFIENLMNPGDCHQDVILAEVAPQFNFIEGARSGVSFIEGMEIANELDSLKPKLHVLYLSESDFTESIADVNVHGDITQVNLKAGKVVPGIMKAPGLKRLLYNWKFGYYLFNRFSASRIDRPGRVHVPSPVIPVANNRKAEQVASLLTFIKQHYNIENKVLVLHPGIPEYIITQLKNTGFKVVPLDSSNDSDWTFGYDPHWTCYGHRQVANQVAKELKTLL